MSKVIANFLILIFVGIFFSPVIFLEGMSWSIDEYIQFAKFHTENMIRRKFVNEENSLFQEKRILFKFLILERIVEIEMY